MSEAQHNYHVSIGEKVASSLAAMGVFGIAGYLLVRNEPFASDQLFIVMRILLSFGAAVLGATIPGFLNFDWSLRGFSIRAGGALALFVLTYVYTPGLVSGFDRPGSPTAGVEANCGSVAAGGNVTSTTIAATGAGCAPKSK